MEKSADAYRTISEAAEELKLPQHVLRFWETRFPQIRPLKRGGNRRFYRPEDVELLGAIKTLLYNDGFTIKGVQRILKERGARSVAGLAVAAASEARLPSAETCAAEIDDGPAADGNEPHPGEFIPSADVLDRLQAVLYELSECRRILSAVRD